MPVHLRTITETANVVSRVPRREIYVQKQAPLPKLVEDRGRGCQPKDKDVNQTGTLRSPKRRVTGTDEKG